MHCKYRFCSRYTECVHSHSRKDVTGLLVVVDSLFENRIHGTLVLLMHLISNCVSIQQLVPLPSLSSFVIALLALMVLVDLSS